MESIKNLMTDIIDRNNISISEFAAVLGINKGTVSSLTNGSRKLTEDTLHKLIDSGILNDIEIENLVDCYFAEEYGEKDLQRIKSFINLLNEQADIESNGFDSPITDISDFNADSEYEFLPSKKDVKKGITALLLNAIKNNQEVYTNYSPDNNDIDDIVYGALLKSESVPKFYHIITLTSEKKSSKNIKIGFSLLKYMRIKVNAYYRIDKNGKKSFSDELYPYYFVTNDTVVFYEQDSSSGVYVRKSDFVQSVFTRFKGQFRNYPLLCRFPENVLSQMDDLSTITDSEIAIRFNPHILNLFTKDDWEVCISDRNENKSALVDLAYSWYASERGLGVVNYSTTDGWLDFLKHGNIMAQPSFLVPDIDIEVRRRTIEKVIDNLKSGVLTHRVLSPKIKLPKKLMIEQIGNYIFFVTMADGIPETQWLGSAFMYIPVKYPLSDFKILGKYLELQGYLYEPEESVRILENMLSHCQNELTIKNILS